MSTQLVPDIFHIGYQRTGSTWLQKGLFPLLSSHVFSVKSAQWKIFHATSINDLSNCYPELNDQDTRNKIIIDLVKISASNKSPDEIAKEVFTAIFNNLGPNLMPAMKRWKSEPPKN